ncbi:MAG TPA: FmdB family zinc ribbon protein [Cellulomonas sp.]|uniref:FmdB family zinc ribbon protein n=1 Tax=Cellulomonas sp. TaxID=40001 RepID=UPI002E373FCF|nr:FmdB family zinc ribbon protein [Cellulomonas sp.]HEX5334216.1 FmdB family zinc ribbon protein [Cellulomonas sp.]
MPIYAYTCTVCGHSFDIQQSFTDSSLTVCPVCDGLLRKVFSPVGVVFKGSGFYRNDSRSKSKSTVSAGTSSSSSTPAASSGDSSPAPTTAAPAKAAAGAPSSSSASSSSSTSTASS